MSQPVQEQEPEIAPILGRKKKQKKEKPAGTSTTAQVERQEVVAPQPTAAVDKPPVMVAPPQVEKAVEKPSTQKYQSAKHAAPVASKGKEREVEKPAVAPPAAAASKAEMETPAGVSPKDREPAAPEKSQPNPSAIFQELVGKGDLPDPERLSMLKPLFTPSPRGDNKEGVRGDAGMPAKSSLSKAEQEMLQAGRVVRKTIDGVRVMITPNGDWIRNLTEEEEDRFLELQARLASSASSAAAYVHPRHESVGGFSLVKGRAVSNGPPSYFPQAAGAHPPDPMTKVQRDEAISYINQYVLPRLNMMSSTAAAAAAAGDRDWKSTLAESAAGLAAQEAGLAAVAPWIYNSMLNSGEPAMDSFSALDDMHHLAGLHLPDHAVADGSSSSSGAHAAATPAARGTGTETEASLLPTYLTGTAASASLASLAGGANLPLLSYEDAEAALAVARRETEKLEKSLAQAVKKNRRILLPGGGLH